MTFTEITQRRVELQAQQTDVPAIRLYIEAPEWQRVLPPSHITYTDDSGVMHQQCGGGHRIIRRKTGGA